MTRLAAAPSFAEIIACPAEEMARILGGDPVEAARWLGAAARYGVVEAQNAYAQLLLDGRGVPRDANAASAWFEVAANAGSVDARNMLGRCHELGWGAPADPGRAAACYREAAEQGLDWAQYNLANLLARGSGVARDRAAALAWYRRAAAQNHAKSLNLVGRFLEEGWSVPADPVAAREHYRRAAEGGDFRGQFNHASSLLRQGEPEAAEPWFRRAAATGTLGFLRGMAGFLEAQPQAALHGIAREARACCAATGEPADLFAHGRGLLVVDRAAARRFLRRSAALGHRPAAQALSRLGLAGLGARLLAAGERFLSQSVLRLTLTRGKRGSTA